MALGTNLQIFDDSIVSEFPEEDLSTNATKTNIEKWPESLGVMLEFNISNVGY